MTPRCLKLAIAAVVAGSVSTASCARPASGVGGAHLEGVAAHVDGLPMSSMLPSLASALGPSSDA